MVRIQRTKNDMKEFNDNKENPNTIWKKAKKELHKNDDE